ncbi:hypothetical protein WDZ92_06055 [Nostoc sp. NIES-2111]
MQADGKEKILEELGRILESPSFRRAPRLQQFLSHVVHIKINGDASQLKESTIGVEVFQREFGYDPKAEPVVRVQARRLREKLSEYYATEGKNAECKIEVPRGTYVPEFRIEIPERTLASDPARVMPKRWPWLVAVLLIAVTAWPLAWWMRRASKPAELSRIASWGGLQYMPAVDPSGKTLAFSWERPGAKVRIYLAELDVPGAEPRRLNVGETEQWRPVWRPDGKALAYLERVTTGGYDVMVFEFATATARRIAHTEALLALDATAPGLDWTPDGAYLLSADQGRPDRPAFLTRIEVATGRKIPISNPPSASSGDVDVKVSPDGRHIAFQRGQLGELWTARLTESGAQEEKRLMAGARGLRGFSWVNSEEIVYGHRSAMGSSAMGKVRLDGSVEEIALHGEQFSDIHYARSRRQTLGARVASDTNLWLLSARAGESKQVVATTRNETLGSVGPKTGALAYVSERSGWPEIWVAKQDGSGARQITHFGKEILISWPEWDSAEQKIAFHARLDGNSDAYIVWPADGKLERLTKEFSRELGGTFTDRDQSLLFTSDRGGSFGVWKMDLRSRMVSSLHAGAGMFCRAWGASGEIVCSRFGAGIEIFLISRGAERRLAHELPMAALSAWDLDEDALYFQDRERKLQRLDIRSGMRTHLPHGQDLAGGALVSLRLHKDGRRFWATRQDLFQSEIAKVEF